MQHRQDTEYLIKQFRRLVKCLFLQIQIAIINGADRQPVSVKTD